MDFSLCIMNFMKNCHFTLLGRCLAVALMHYGFLLKIVHFSSLGLLSSCCSHSHHGIDVYFDSRFLCGFPATRAEKNVK